MSLKLVDQAPRDVVLYPSSGELSDRMTPQDVQLVAEIFQTPLQGSYSWDYESADEKLRRLYKLGKSLNWNAETDLDWSGPTCAEQHPMNMGINPVEGYPEFEALNEEEKQKFHLHTFAWVMSQFLHGEQGALLVASQLISCAPTYDAKLYAASQTFDEARHVEVFTRYLKEKVGVLYPVNRHLKSLLDKILTDPRWDLKFIGMQIIVEGLAIAAFSVLKDSTQVRLLKDLLALVLRDESRHVAFGMVYLEEFVKELSPKDREDRARFAYEACVVMRERLIATDVYEHYGWNVEAARKKAFESFVYQQFRSLLFTRIMPNLRRIGLLTDAVRPLYEELGILKFENLVDDGEVDWAKLEN